MWMKDRNYPARGFSTPQPAWKSRFPHSPVTVPPPPMSERKSFSTPNKSDPFHVLHKVPAGDSPYVKAKQVQLIEKDPSRAVSLFWAAINAGDRIDSALKDMAVVMKQLNRSDEAIEAIKSFRDLCPFESQDSIDNLLIELYKRSGRIEEEVDMLQHKLNQIEEGVLFGGKKTKTSRSQGKKIHITIEQEKSRILGNLAWAHLQLNNLKVAEELYRKALSLEPDKNKQCNLAFCLLHMNRIAEAKSLLHNVRASCRENHMDDSYAKSFDRALQMLTELESQSVVKPNGQQVDNHLEINSSTITCDPGLMVSKCWENGNDTETVKKDSPSMFSDKSKKDPMFEIACEKWSGFARKMKEGQGSTAYHGTYASPDAVRNFRVPFTQSRRRCSWGFTNGDKRRETRGEDAVRGTNRKLSFEQPFTLENVRAQNIQNLAEESQTSIKAEDALHKYENDLPFSTRDWKRMPWGDHKQQIKDAALVSVSHPIAKGKRNWKRDGFIQVPNETVMKSILKPGDWNRNSWKIDDQKIDAIKERHSIYKFPIVPELCGTQGSLDECVAGTPEASQDSFSDIIEEEHATKDIFQTPRKCFNGWNNEEEFPLQTQDIILRDKSKKSWADMVEEEEEEHEADFLNENWDFRTPSEESNNNENADSNIMCGTPLQNKVLNFEACSHEVGNERTIMRRNRLQVFRDITLIPESP